MSIKSIKDKSISNNALMNGDIETTWNRPTDWLTLPTIGPNDQKCAMLVAVFDNESNYVAFSATGNYTVNWGDGSSENVATGVKAQHKYDWNNISSSTLTTEGFRQAIIVVTPQAGQTLSGIDFQKSHSSVATSSSPQYYLDMKIGITGSLNLSHYINMYGVFPLLKILTIENHQTNISSSLLRGGAENVAQVYINKPNLNILGSGPFQYSASLEYVYLHPTTISADCSNLFLNCAKLVEAPYIKFSGSNNLMVSMFQGCSSLKKVPAYEITGSFSMANMFQDCVALEEVPWMNTSLVANFYNMFQGCSSLKSVPNFNLNSATNTANMFNGCKSLQKVPSWNLSNVTTTSSMFQGCWALKEVPNFNLSSCASIDSMFNDCKSLEYVPDMFTRAAGISSMNYPFSNNTGALKKFPTFTKFIGTTFGYGGNSTYVRENPSIDIGTATTINMYGKLIRSQLYNAKVTHTYANMLLGKNALIEIFNNLGTPATSQTLTITGNPGANENPIYSRSSTTTSGSTTITITDTSNFVIGTQVTGTGISTAIAVTFQDSGDTVTLVGHGIPNDKRVSFTTIVTTTGISVYTPYYVVNATTDTFQLSLTQGGSPIALTTNGTGNVIYQTLVTDIVPNTSVTIDIPASASGTNTLVYRNLNTQLAVMRRWTVSG